MPYQTNRKGGKIDFDKCVDCGELVLLNSSKSGIHGTRCSKCFREKVLNKRKSKR